jgi:hypothetical protein
VANDQSSEPKSDQKTNGGAKPNDQSSEPKSDATAARAQPARQLKHTGFLVHSPIRHLTPKGAEVSRNVGDVIRISDLREDDRARFEAGGYLSPHLEPV